MCKPWLFNLRCKNCKGKKQIEKWKLKKKEKWNNKEANKGKERKMYNNVWEKNRVGGGEIEGL